MSKSKTNLEKLHDLIFGLEHGEDCDRSGHDDCGLDTTEKDNWYCEQLDDREDCESRECTCSLEKMKHLAHLVLDERQPKETVQ